MTANHRRETVHSVTAAASDHAAMPSRLYVALVLVQDHTMQRSSSSCNEGVQHNLHHRMRISKTDLRWSAKGLPNQSPGKYLGKERKTDSPEFWGKGIGHEVIAITNPLRDGEIPNFWKHSSASLWWNGGEIPKRIESKTVLGGEWNAFALHSNRELKKRITVHLPTRVHRAEKLQIEES